MTKRYILAYMSWLLHAHMAAALAGTAPQQYVYTYSSVQCKGSAAATSMPTQAADSMTASATDLQLPTTTSMAQESAPKYYNIAASMVEQRAWMYSAVLPGWGQIYNKQYWKVPVIYLGFAGLGWGAIYYHREYVACKQKMAQKRWDNSPKNYIDDCRRGRDLCIIFAALWYGINIFDAYAGASLRTFTLSDDISMEMQPGVLPTADQTPCVGLSLTLSFGK